jgi:hypothetical protein
MPVLCEFRHCERSAGIQDAVIASGVRQSSKTKCVVVIANEVKQSSCLLSWIATSATPSRNDEASRRSDGIPDAVIANKVKQSSKTKMHLFKPPGLPRQLRLLAMTKRHGEVMGFNMPSLRMK